MTEPSTEHVTEPSAEHVTGPSVPLNWLYRRHIIPRNIYYLSKMNRYTLGESVSMHRDGQAFHWQHAVSHFVEDMRGSYDYGRAYQNGVRL